MPTRSPDVAASPAFAALKAADHPRGTGRGWTPEPFFDADPVATTLPAPHWTLPVGALGRAAAGPTAAGPFPPGPLPPAVSKAVGLAAPKLALFSEGHPLEDRRAIALLASPAFAGDCLILEGAGDRAFDPAARERIDVSPEVVSFGANHLRLRVSAPRPAWLVYADAWDEGWTATVDGVSMTVARANVGYKAVPIEAGNHAIEFRYREPVRKVALMLQPWLALATVLASLVLTSHLLGGDPP
jgi:hypothetical protein